MITRQEIFKEILEDQAVTDAVLATSAAFKDTEDARYAFPHYFRVAAALSDVVNRLDLPGKNSPPEATGAATLIPFITLGMPGLHEGFDAHWGDAYLTSQGVPEVFFEEEALKARESGEAGTPNYMHGLLVLAFIGDTFVQLAGTGLMVSAAVNIEEGLSEEALH